MIMDVDPVVGNDGIQFPNIKLYKKRWLMLFIYAMNSLANATLYNTVSAMNDISSKYYNVSPSTIDWSANSFSLVYIIIALPSAYFMTSFGLRISMLLGASLNAIAACLHFAGYQQHGFLYVMSGQIASALSVGAVLQIPPRLATVWFGKDEHSRATSIGIFCNILGISVGYLQPTHMVPKSNNMEEVSKGMFNLYLSQMIFLFICLMLVYLFFEDQPPSPPSYAALLSINIIGEHSLSFSQSIKALLTDLNFHLLTQAYGFYFGMYSFFTVVLNAAVTSNVTETQIGWMGFSANCFGILGVMLSGLILDKFKCYRLTSIVLILGSLVVWVAFTLTLIHTDSEVGLFITYSALGFFGISYFSSGIEQAAEMTYPVSEDISSAFILIAGNLYSFLLILILGSWIEKGKIVLVSYVTIGVYTLSLIFICATRTKMKRYEAEHSQKNLVTTGSTDILNPLIS